MKICVCLDYNLEKLIIAETPEKLLETALNYHIDPTDTLLYKELDTDERVIRIEWKDKYCDEDDTYEVVYDYSIRDMNSLMYIR